MTRVESSALLVSDSGVALWTTDAAKCRCGRMANLWLNVRGVTGCVACTPEVKP